MRTHFDFPEFCEHYQICVSKDELYIAIPQIIAANLNFEVVNLEDGNYLIECRSKNDNDVCLIKEHIMSCTRQ